MCDKKVKKQQTTDRKSKNNIKQKMLKKENKYKDKYYA